MDRLAKTESYTTQEFYAKHRKLTVQLIYIFDTNSNQNKYRVLVELNVT